MLGICVKILTVISGYQLVRSYNAHAVLVDHARIRVTVSSRNSGFPTEMTDSVTQPASLETGASGPTPRFRPVMSQKNKMFSGTM
jgi:hypothetical protein